MPCTVATHKAPGCYELRCLDTAQRASEKLRKLAAESLRYTMHLMQKLMDGCCWVNMFCNTTSTRCKAPSRVCVTWRTGVVLSTAATWMSHSYRTALDCSCICCE
jgi:hypothetical protein